MQNSYIVDAFLTGAAWMVLIFLYFDSRARIKALSEVISTNTLAVALSRSAKLATSLAVPAAALYLFALWRFYALMVQTQTWGAGGIGLLAALAFIGVPLIWLVTMLICVSHSPFANLPIREQVNKYPKQTNVANKAGYD